MAANASVIETTGRPAALRMVSPAKANRPRKEQREAEEALRDLDENFLECRDLHHPWKVIGCFYVGTEVRRRLVCPRCKTEATDRWTGKGERIARAYKYPKDYKVEGTKVTAVDVRREVLQRVDVFKTEDDLLQSLFRGKQRKRA